MKIIGIGDPHGDLKKVKKIPLKGVDLILLTGDLGKANLARKMFFENMKSERAGKGKIKYPRSKQKRAFMEQYRSTVRIVKYLSRFAPVYTIFGNVEKTNARVRKISKEMKMKLPFISDKLKSMKNVKVINDKIVKFKGVRIGGLAWFVDTGWVREFKPLDYKTSLKDAKKKTDRAKKILRKFKGVDIFVCHQPPYGILDKVSSKWGAPKVWWGKHAGSKAILDYVKRQSPANVFCGHIHEGVGKKKFGKTMVYNLGVCDYKVLEIEK